MAANRQRKAAVRARMERTGESYQTALQTIKLGRPEPVGRDDRAKYGSRMTDAEVVAEYGEHLGIRLPRVFTADEHREAGYPDARQGETYLVTFDEPDAEGYLGRRLELVFVVVPGTKSDHDLVEKRFRELHQNAVDVRVVYA